MIARTPEPEVMDDGDEVEAYRKADFRTVNRLCARRAFRACLKSRGHALDVGCGPAEIPILFCALAPLWRVTALDASSAMLREAAANVRGAGLTGRIQLLEGDANALHRIRERFDLVFSNSLLHHLHDPIPFWKGVRRLVKPGGSLLVQDLFRPESSAQARSLVSLHTRGASPLLKRLFHQSLLAAFTPREVRLQLREAGIQNLQVRKVSDRHMVVRGILEAQHP